MGLGVHFNEDIAAVLRGLAFAAVGRHPDYFAALGAVALALGVPVDALPVVLLVGDGEGVRDEHATLER